MHYGWIYKICFHLNERFPSYRPLAKIGVVLISMCLKYQIYDPHMLVKMSVDTLNNMAIVGNALDASIY